MDYRAFGNKFIVRLNKGEEIVQKIKDLVEKENIKLGSIIGIGAVDIATIGLFDTNTKEYHSTKLEGDFEITSLVGNISTKNGETYLHMHIALGDEEYHVYGGHLNEAFVSATCELIIEKIDGVVEREFDENSGLNLLKFVD
ncbi:MAG: DNA-binding protein [Tissierellales bacterium]|nr:DNA-binding protein [Tissierellales bacterium]